MRRTSTCGSRIRGFAWSRIAASTLRERSASGSLAKNWSSASSLQTRIASPRSRRPARPHCWRSDAIGSGEADRDRAVEQADVDSRARARRLPSRRGARPRRAAARSRDAARACSPRGTARAGSPSRIDALGREAVDQLGSLAALREADRPQAPRGERGEETRGVAERARAEAELGVEERRVPDDDLALGSRGRVASTTVARSPVSSSASSPAFAIVADASRNCGSAS